MLDAPCNKNPPAENKFLDTLRQERKSLEPAAEARGIEKACEAAAAANDAYRACNEERQRGGGGSSATVREHELNAAVTAANQAVADLKQPQERALARIKEIDRLLSASADRDRGRKELARLSASLRDNRARITQLDQIISELEAEVEELGAKRASAMANHGREELATRLAGKPASSPKGVVAIDGELEGRRAALDAALAAKVEIEGPRALQLQAMDDIRNRLREALGRCAEIDYYGELQTLMPIIGRLVACNSALGGYRGHGVFEIRYDAETVSEATAALRAELNAGAAAQI